MWIIKITGLKSASKMPCVYVLQLPNGKYYVGKSDGANPDLEWARVHEPVELVEVIQDADGDAADRVIKKYIGEHDGKATLNGDACLRCGRQGPWARECCPKNQIESDEEECVSSPEDESAECVGAHKITFMTASKRVIFKPRYPPKSKKT